MFKLLCTIFMLHLQLQNQQAKVQGKFCNTICTLYLHQYIVHRPQPAGVHQPQPAGVHQRQPAGIHQPQSVGVHQLQATDVYQPQPTGVHQTMPVDNRNPSAITHDGMLIKLLPNCS